MFLTDITALSTFRSSWQRTNKSSQSHDNRVSLPRSA